MTLPFFSYRVSRAHLREIDPRELLGGVVLVLRREVVEAGIVRPRRDQP
jgi:hypothetical protein